ncbi:MAG: GIY-YIG nuclease family protein [Bacteroidia bacterium]|nr:GIY-YIG nuclease family protein [Bacteroidia bacterium]
MKHHNYFVYILTNKNKTVLYIGVTNDIERRLFEHENNQQNKFKFTSKYNCTNLIYFEIFSNINNAIDRETELKKWRREKKENLINSINPDWNFLNEEVKERYFEK